MVITDQRLIVDGCQSHYMIVLSLILTDVKAISLMNVLLTAVHLFVCQIKTLTFDINEYTIHIYL